jgi:diguanylate cyclase (GGDEF)-like protein
MSWAQAAAALRRLLGHAIEPHILFPGIAIALLAIIWGTTLQSANEALAAAERALAISAQYQSETYEAQLVRALREIDQTLKYVKYVYELDRRRPVLDELKVRELLPPGRLFTVSIADGGGNVIASTQASSGTSTAADRAYFGKQHAEGSMLVGHSHKQAGTEGWILQFSRRLDAADGGFAGTVIVSVAPDYFVSGYDAAKMGEDGVMGLLGTDGVFRVRRTGDTVWAGDIAPYAALVPNDADSAGDATLSENAWDDVSRYTSVRRLHDFPVAVVVGLSAEEHLAAAHRARRIHFWQASGASVVVIVILAALGLMRRQLDLSRRRASEEQVAHAARVEHLAYHDALTTLPNRSLFSNLLGHSIKLAHRRGRQLAVLFLDLDRFKHINDTLGHEAGDELLREVAVRLRASLRESDTVARLGGDEFVAMLPELEGENYVSVVAQKILTANRASLHPSRPGIPRHGECRHQHLPPGRPGRADTEEERRYRHVSREGGRQEQLPLLLREAQCLLARAPCAGIGPSPCAGAWRVQAPLPGQEADPGPPDHGNGGAAALAAPDLGPWRRCSSFPSPRRAALIVPIGKWVLRAACQQHHAWAAQGFNHLSMAVNLTAGQFTDESLLADLAVILAETGMDARLLELEISESVLMRDVAKAIRILGGLKALGIRIAIDDFGVGYSSLARLERYPLDTIKIDRSFIRDATGGAANAKLTESIIAMGKALSLTVVAQGVETKEQADFLRENACDEFQGFYLDKPLPADQIAQVLRAQVAPANEVYSDPTTTLKPPSTRLRSR